MGQSTGSNPSATGKKVGNFLKKFKDSPATKTFHVRRAMHRIVPKIQNRIEKNNPSLDKNNKSNLKKWGGEDFMKNMVDWKVQLGSKLLEGSLGSAKALRALKAVKNKDTDHKDDAYKQYTKWQKKKMIRTSKPSYKKHVLGEQE